MHNTPSVGDICLSYNIDTCQSWSGLPWVPTYVVTVNTRIRIHIQNPSLLHRSQCGRVVLVTQFWAGIHSMCYFFTQSIHCNSQGKWRNYHWILTCLLRLLTIKLSCCENSLGFQICIIFYNIFIIKSMVYWEYRLWPAVYIWIRILKIHVGVIE